MNKVDKKLYRGENGCSYTLKRDYRAVFGFGEKFDSVNQKGKFVRACVREKCFYQGEYAYYSMPFLVTPDGFGVYVDTYVEVDFDLRKEGEIVITFPLGSGGEVADIYLFEGTVKEIITKFRSLTGYSRIFSKWVLGAWMSGNRWHTQEEVDRQRRLAKENNFPHNVLVIEPWSDLTTHYLFNDSRMPHKAGDEGAKLSEIAFGGKWSNPKKLIEDVHSDNLKVLLWIIPSYSAAENHQTACNAEQSLSDNEYTETHGDCVMNADGTPYRIPHTWCIGDTVPDFTDDRATKHWFNRFEYLKELGIDGFKTDGGEFIHDKTVKFADGTTGLEGQNRYSELYAKTFSEFIGDNGVIFSRAGGQRSPQYTVLWAGDQESTWSEFRSILKAGLSAGISGAAVWGFDIAGFSGYLPTEELYLRAVQTAAFVPIMQWHSDPVSNGRCDFSGAWKINDRSPWNMAAYHKNPGLLDTLRKQFFLHYNLVPYLYQLMTEAGTTGIPIMRHLALEFPDDEKTYGIEDEFMLGSALLIAPVLDDYIASRKVYLPKGSWRHLFTGEMYEGGKYEIALDREYLPVFFRENSGIPLNLKGGKLMSDVSNRLDGYTELTFLVSGRGKTHFSDDLGNEILLNWTENEFTVLKNKTDIPVCVLHLERDNVINIDKEEL